MKAVIGKQLDGGKWHLGEGTSWERRSPATGDPVWVGQWSSFGQLDQAIAEAQSAFGGWAESHLEDRMTFCRAFAQYVHQHQSELAHLIAIETGKPLWEARTEAAAVQSKVDNSIDALLHRRWTTTGPSGDYMAVTRFRPHGVLLVLGPFNLPAHLPGAHIVPALLAGNTVVFKPSEHTPATGQWLASAWQHAGLPPGVLNMVHGSSEIGQQAVADERIAGVLFTGSYQVGVQIHRTLAGRPEKLLALELGGNNPLVVHRTSDFRRAAITAVMSAYITSGQRCTCARRLIVTGREDFEKLSCELLQLIPKIKVGLPLDEIEPFMGPLIHGEAASRMLTAQNQLLAVPGCHSLITMQTSECCPAMLTPGLMEIPETAVIPDCEHFGPLLLMQCAEDLEHATEIANRTKFGLAAGFLGDSVDDFHFFLHRVRAGIVNWNRQTTGASGRLPFGGIGQSGNHHPSGYFAADYCSYPVASLESHDMSEASRLLPGLDFGA
ncbi:MAG: succinylglutamate-semialdehyde dehydrogenase [Planctomycetales bacterium]|nr:succinylglutamate-semialdehyde dehydrogenase [Planctomycetales bacterium]